jgi:hypothetical protein
MKGKFAARISAKGKKTNNHPKSRQKKVMIREMVMGEIAKPRVMDAFAGSGQMWRSVWRSAEHYRGCDLKWYPDERWAYVADNRRVLRCIDLQDFNIFDFDAYGSPWEHCLILARRRIVKPAEKLGLVLTDGSGMKLKMGQAPSALAELAGLATKTLPGLNGEHDFLLKRAIAELCRRMNARVLRHWEARGTTGVQVRYIGLVLEGISDAA